MKFLLTSAGITNRSIAEAIADLVCKPENEISVLFVPTAANTVKGDKSWLDDDVTEFKKQGYKSVDVFDIASADERDWRPKMEVADLICFGGGNEQYLAKVMRDSGVDKALPDLLKTRVYMGISAGSMVVGQFLSNNLMKVVYPEESFEELAAPLAYVDCLFIPHLNSEYFAHVRKEVLEKYKADFAYPLYACDDDSALKVIDGKIEVVGEGECAIFI
jgi:dipeptidase E